MNNKITPTPLQKTTGARLAEAFGEAQVKPWMNGAQPAKRETAKSTPAKVWGFTPTPNKVMVWGFILSPLLSIIGVLFASSAKAVCPVCTIAVCAGVGLSRWLKIDDTITGIWLGGFVVSMIIWTLAWFNKKNINFKGKNLITIGAFYLFVLLPLLYKDMLGQPLNKLWGMDKLGLGIVMGTVGFSLGVGLHNYLKKKNQGKSYFIYQKVAFPIAPLIILTVVFYILIKFCF